MFKGIFKHWDPSSRSRMVMASSAKQKFHLLISYSWNFFHSLAPPQKVHSFSSNFLTGIGRALLVMNSCHFIHLSFGPQEKDCNVYLLWAHWICKQNQFGQLWRYLQTTQTNGGVLTSENFFQNMLLFLPVSNLKSAKNGLQKSAKMVLQVSMRQFLKVLFVLISRRRFNLSTVDL